MPVANAGPDDAICQGNNYPITAALAQNTTAAGIQWTENGPGTLLNANTINPTYITAPGETGIVTFTLTVDGTLSCTPGTCRR
jgi:hypothetical protein